MKHSINSYLFLFLILFFALLGNSFMKEGMFNYRSTFNLIPRLHLHLDQS